MADDLKPGARLQQFTVVEVLGRHLAQLQNRAWVPPPAADSAKPAGLPTSVTICPSCGASLHVPDAGQLRDGASNGARPRTPGDCEHHA